MRDPHYTQIERDIDAVCHQVLTDTNAFDFNANLRPIERYVNRRFVAMRENINNTLKKRKKNPNKNKLQLSTSAQRKSSLWEETARKYHQRLRGHCARSSPTCMEVMGSIARKETTSYSNFESFILLQNSFKTNSLELPRILEISDGMRLYFKLFWSILERQFCPVLPSLPWTTLKKPVTRGGVEETRLEAKAKDTKQFQGQGQTLSRPRPDPFEAKAKDTDASVLQKKKKKKS